MYRGIVAGTVVATVKESHLEGVPLLVVRKIENGVEKGLIVAADHTRQAGYGDEVYLLSLIHIWNEDMAVNVCKKKQLTNMRAAGSDEAVRLVPPRVLSLEQCLEYLADDELLEVTPQNLRMRKQILDHSVRMRQVMKNRQSGK